MIQRFQNRRFLDKFLKGDGDEASPISRRWEVTVLVEWLENSVNSDETSSQPPRSCHKVLDILKLRLLPPRGTRPS
jgi:hypothetical protein